MPYEERSERLCDSLTQTYFKCGYGDDDIDGEDGGDDDEVVVVMIMMIIMTTIMKMEGKFRFSK